MPGACLGGGTCRDLEAQLAGIFDTPSCTGDTACACSVTQDLNSTETGTYTVSGWLLETAPSAGAATQTNYCVTGNQLHFINVDPATPVVPSPPATITSDTVLERQ